MAGPARDAGVTVVLSRDSYVNQLILGLLTRAHILSLASSEFTIYLYVDTYIVAYHIMAKRRDKIF